MKQLLIDHTPFHIAKMTISEAKVSGDGRMRITGKLQESGVKNGNGRIYPPEILKKQVFLKRLHPINAGAFLTQVFAISKQVAQELEISEPGIIPITFLLSRGSVFFLAAIFISDT